jgi:hypothetical protein
MRALVSASLLLALTSGAALAQTAGENGRYSMTPTEGGFLRLDTRTGEVALCRPSGDSVVCRTSPNDRGALEEEIDRLAKENADLKARLAEAAPPPPGARSRTQEEMDRAMDFAERFMRRMMRIMREEAPQDRT